MKNLMTARQPKSDGASGLTNGSTADWPGMPEKLKSTGPSAVVTGGAAAAASEEVTRLFNEAGLTISASTVHAIQSQRDDREVGRPNARNCLLYTSPSPRDS